MACRERQLALAGLVFLEALSSSEDDDLIQPPKKRGMWMRPHLRKYREQGCYENLMRELALEDAESYRSWIRMDTATFEELLGKVRPLIVKQDTPFRQAIPAGERLAITLRYPAIGETFASTGFQFRRAHNTVSKIVHEACITIYEVLAPDFIKTGFRKNLGTQDSLVLIREYLVNRPTHCHPQLLVAVDIKKAFDTLPHATVIDTARKLGVRGRPLNFIKAFLSGRKYLVKTGKHCISEQKTNEIGVPQGAVLSPVLFKLAMAPLLWRLAVIPDLAFTVYADDITAWTMGSDNAPPPETTIQRALDVVSDFLKEVGLHPSPEKTRYLDFGKGWEKIDADLRFDGEKIDKVAEHSILGVNIHQGGNPSAWIERMRSTWKKGPQVAYTKPQREISCFVHPSLTSSSDKPPHLLLCLRVAVSECEGRF
ncbi:uncharacterized protein ISCGN_024581 [Ixodes scapularis]